MSEANYNVLMTADEVAKNAKETKENSKKLFQKQKKEDTFKSDEKKIPVAVSVNIGNSVTNMVPIDKLRVIQSQTLNKLKDYLSMTFGPMGSYTKIIKGGSKDTINSSYSKDGLKVLMNISDAGPIEMSIIEELIEITRHVEHEVGDGTTSTVILSSLIFDWMVQIQEKYKIPPFQLIRKFGDIVDLIKDVIIDHGRKCELDDIYDIAMISTNGNTIVSKNIRDIYKNYGFDVDLSVGISNSPYSVIMEYDGLTITEGMSDPVYITNKEKGISEIPNAHIYHFKDPIDDMYMITLFEAILQHNIYDAYENNEPPIPTVITCPRISRDMSTTLRMLANQLYQFDTNDAQSSKPPILIITDVVASDEIIMDDIANLCGCKSIGKYIDPKLLKRDQENGTAPTVDNVWEFAGKAERVISDSHKTKFINPLHMRIYEEDGTVKEDPIYTAMVNFLETEIENTSSTDSANEIGLLKKRLAALKANTVDYLVGGITVSDRDALKDLVEDAVKNCKSAAQNGVGFAANYEAFKASFELMKQFENDEDSTSIQLDIIRAIYCSYYDITKILYSTVCGDEDKVDDYVCSSIGYGRPYNVSSGELPRIDSVDNSVKCSIMLDIHILDTISRIISMMVTCNQCLLQAPSLNTY